MVFLVDIIAVAIEYLYSTSQMDISPALSNYVNGLYRDNLYSVPLRGMQRAQAQALEASTQIAHGEISAREMVNLRTSLYSFEANALVLRSIDRMQGTLLNTLA